MRGCATCTTAASTRAAPSSYTDIGVDDSGGDDHGEEQEAVLDHRGAAGLLRLELLDFLEKLAPFSAPSLILRDTAPRMNPLSPEVSTVAQTIQLSLSPIFMLAGIGALLNVLAVVMLSVAFAPFDCW